jgi:hypothetical protein
LKFQFSTLNEYFTSRAKDIEQQETHRERAAQRTPDAPSQAALNESAFPSLPPGRDFFPFAPPQLNHQYRLFV